jgi:hypothetical protein
MMARAAARPPVSMAFRHSPGSVQLSSRSGSSPFIGHRRGSAGLGLLDDEWDFDTTNSPELPSVSLSSLRNTPYGFSSSSSK